MDERQARLVLAVCAAVAVGAWVGFLAALARESVKAVKGIGDTAAAEVKASGEKYRDTITLARYQAEMDEG